MYLGDYHLVCHGRAHERDYFQTECCSLVLAWKLVVLLESYAIDSSYDHSTYGHTPDIIFSAKLPPPQLINF